MHNYSHKLIKLKAVIMHNSSLGTQRRLPKQGFTAYNSFPRESEGVGGSKKTIEDWVGVITQNSKLIYYDEQDNTDHNG